MRTERAQAERLVAVRSRPAQELRDRDVAQMLDGDECAFDDVYRAVHPGILEYVASLVGTGDAEDVVSETWGQACRDLGQFAGDASGFRRWITTIARNRSLDHLRAQRRRPAVQDAFGELVDRAAPDNVEATVRDVVATGEAIALIRTLPPEQAEAVLLRAVMGLDAKSAGRILGRSPGAVRTAAYRGLHTLQDRILITAR